MTLTKTTARRVCFSCGHLIRVDETVCTYCAKEVAKPSRLVPCSQCGQKISPIRAICQHCSLDMTEPCPACGMDIRSDWSVCPCCGCIRADIRASKVKPVSSKRRRFPVLAMILAACVVAACLAYWLDAAALFVDEDPKMAVSESEVEPAPVRMEDIETGPRS